MPKKFLFCAAAIIAVYPLAAMADASAEIKLAADHAGFAAQGKDLNTVHMHLHHALNCLEGPMGVGFDKNETNPCDGKGAGAIKDAMTAETQKALQDAAAEAKAGIGETALAAAQRDAEHTESMLKALEK